MATLSSTPGNPPSGTLTTSNPLNGTLQSGIDATGAKLATLFTGLAEEVDGYKEQWANDGTQRVTRRFKVKWGARKYFVDQMLGYSTTLPGVIIAGQPAAPPLLTRTPPDKIPEQGYQHLYASEVNMVGVTGQGAAGFWAKNPNVFYPDGVTPADMIAYFDAGTGQDGLAMYDVVYTARDYEVRTDAEAAAIPGGQPVELQRYVNRKKKSALQALPLPTGTVIWLDGPNKGHTIPDPAAFIYLNTIAFEYTWHEVPDDPTDAANQCAGRVNSATFDGARGAWGGNTFLPGTLLCQAPLLTERYRHSTGRVYWRIIYSFLYRSFANPAIPGTVLGWSAIPDSTGDFWPIGFQSNSKPIYPSADFNKLFIAPAPGTYQ